jgi:pullulanase/glycogen debranching enzyme
MCFPLNSISPGRKLQALVILTFVLTLFACSVLIPPGLTARKTYSPLADVDSLYSDLPLGATFAKGATAFRLFAPHATRVSLVLLPRYDAMSGEEIRMSRDRNGVWSTSRLGRLSGQVYAYRLWGNYNPDLLISDPYAQVVISQNNYQRNSRAMIPWDRMDWRGDNWAGLDPRDAIIYEMHVRDMTAHPSAHSPHPGTYRGLVQEQQAGGIAHLKELGVNAVELLPVFDFGNIEIPYQDTTDGVYNDWNPYARNHWGYMTTHFFAPEAYYATAGTMSPDLWLGWTGHQLREFKEMVRRFHQNGIAVLLDVAYNHVSQFDLNPLKYIDKAYYFRLNQDGSYLSESGCGNDLRTEAPMVKRLIVDSVLYWMQGYHIDGFRFDLAGLIDEQTARIIIREARRINPDVIIIAEPWGGSNYVPDQYADLGWAAWNDQFRNGIKGWDALNDRGFIFGSWQGENGPESLKRYFLGSPRDLGGQFHRPSQSVNYLASHDDQTLGDFVRIATGKAHPDSIIADLDSHVAAQGKQLATSKLAALCLLTAQGATMIHEGQDFGRSKVIAPTSAPDARVGHIDHNSYEKDDDTNYLNWEHKELNRDLFDYYQGLIRLRKAHKAFRRANVDSIRFLNGQTEFGLAFLLPSRPAWDDYDFLVLLNGNVDQPEEFVLPEGQWSAVVTWNQAGTEPIVKGLSGVITVPPTAGMVLRK